MSPGEPISVRCPGAGEALVDLSDRQPFLARPADDVAGIAEPAERELPFGYVGKRTIEIVFRQIEPAELVREQFEPNIGVDLRLQGKKGGESSDPGIVLRTGTTLVRQWRGHTHTVLVRGIRPPGFVTRTSSASIRSASPFSRTVIASATCLLLGLDDWPSNQPRDGSY